MVGILYSIYQKVPPSNCISDAGPGTLEMYPPPPIGITSLLLVPINNVFETKEYANSPSDNEAGVAVTYERKICIVVFAI